jgi:hypothetical protein
MKGSRGNLPVKRCGALLAATMLLVGANAHAFDLGLGSFGGYNDGKVLATPGVQMVDGASGGGITPWATITGYETRDGINGTLHFTYVNLPNYSLDSLGAAVGFYDRLELSYSYDILPTGSTFDTVGLLTGVLSGSGGNNAGIDAWNTTIKMQVFGAKVRLFGEAIYDSDNLIPQVSAGAFFKYNHNKQLLETLGAAKNNGNEYYLAATKIFFPLSTLLNVTLRYSDANEDGLTGFGGPNGSKHQIRPEVSLAYLLAKNTAVGGEWMKHGDNLGGQSVNLSGLNLNSVTPILQTLGLGSTSTNLTQLHESNWEDFFMAYFFNKNLSATAAVGFLGNITLTPNQVGYYISMQASF